MSTPTPNTQPTQPPLPARPNPHVALAIAVRRPTWWSRAALEDEHRRVHGRDWERGLFEVDGAS